MIDIPGILVAICLTDSSYRPVATAMDAQLVAAINLLLWLQLPASIKTSIYPKLQSGQPRAPSSFVSIMVRGIT